MQFHLSDEQLMLKGLVERLVADHYSPAKRATYRRSAEAYSRENWSRLGELGLLATPFRPEHGGLGGGPAELIVLMEALGGGLVVEPVLEQVIAPGRLLAHLISVQRRDDWLHRIMSGDVHLALAHIERDAGFDLSDVNTKAWRGAAGLRLQGEKTIVFGGGGCDGFIVSAREEGRIGFHVVNRDAPGLSVQPFRLADGSMACSLRFDDALVAETLDVGFEAFAQAVDDVRLAACAEMLGIMSTLFETTLDYVRNRRQFGTTLGSFQVIQHLLAEQFVRLEQSRSQLYRAALRPGVSRASTIAGMKSYIGCAAIQMGEQCIHLHGGMGITEDLMIGHGHKRILVLATMFGDVESELERFTLMRAQSDG